MPANKNQHFVPRCLLKPFSSVENGSAVSLYNAKSDALIRVAPVKGKCSGDYFYGEDLKIERFLQGIEGHYATIISRLVNDRLDISSTDLMSLRSFAYLQMNRTDLAVKRRTQAYREMHEITHRGFEDHTVDAPNTSHSSMVMTAMRMWSETIERVSDLDVVIMRNKTRRDFVLGDDPAVLTNRLHMQRLGDKAFGLTSAGTQLTMPLTPRFALLCYDRGAYSLPNRQKYWIDITKDVDVLALNELQYISCDKNIYFQNWDEREDIRNNFIKVALRRPGTWFRFWVGVLVKEDARGETYRRATESEIASKATKVTSISPVYPNPSRWLGELIYRPRVFAYSNGSAVGFVRGGQVAALGSRDGFRREEVKYDSAYSPLGPRTAYLRKT